jgi:lantibiotic modifying enzyme
MGIGSLVYGLCLVDSVSSLGTLSDARRASELVTRDRIADDGMYGVLGGSAGAVLALLALADRTGGSEPVATAVACGEHLLSNRTGAGGRAWIRDGESGPKTGFAHGASGIAFALARLADVTGETRFRTAATEALAVERERADSARRGDLDPARSAVGNNTWCNGRTGLGLARLGLFEHDAGVERSVARSALDAVDHTQLDRHDTFCHGNASRAACLLRGGRSLDAPAYERRARDLLSATCARADAADGYLFSVGTRRLQAPSLFGGLSGLGYTLLRVARPALPSLVAWE